MCVAGLNVSTQPCAHRWYQLVRPCRPSANLASCVDKLQLKGWETRIDNCPFCEPTDENMSETTHRLIGSNGASLSPVDSLGSRASFTSVDARSRSPSILPPAQLTASLQRHGSMCSVGSTGSVGSIGSSIDSERGQRDREMNERLMIYLTAKPHEILPSARKNYPTYPQTQLQSITDDTSSDTSSLRLRNGNVLSAGFRKGMCLGKAIISGGSNSPV